MSDQLGVTEREPVVEPADRRRFGPRQAWSALIVVLVIVAVGLVVLAGRGDGSGARPSPSRGASNAVASVGDVPRLFAVRALLQRRSAAVVHHDRAAFLSTVDPSATRFRRAQGRMFANLADVRFATWSYRIGSGSMGESGRLRARYGAPTWSPRHFTLRYRIAGFDRMATRLPQYPTFVERSGRWYLAALSDFRSRGDISASDLWDYAPVHVVQQGGVLALGPTSEIGTIIEVADQMQAAIPKVSAVWGPRWARRVVVQIPATQQEMGAITGDHGDLDQIAAITSAEVSREPGHPEPVGDRVTINPRNWLKLGPTGETVTLTHELTHVATEADTGVQTPKWLAEGFADYVGFRGTGLPVASIAAELRRQVRAGHLPARLPTNADFRGSNRRLPQAYEAGWLACRYLAAHDGQAALVRFYRAVGTSGYGRTDAVRRAMRNVLDLSVAQFTDRWRGFVQAQLTS